MDDKIVVLTENGLTELIRRTVAMVLMDLETSLAQKPIPELMNKIQIAEYLVCHVSKIDRYMRRSQIDPLPFDKFGDTPLFRKGAVDEWLKRQKKQRIE